VSGPDDWFWMLGVSPEVHSLVNEIAEIDLSRAVVPNSWQFSRETRRELNRIDSHRRVLTHRAVGIMFGAIKKALAARPVGAE
jgi:hypothetical protein